MREKKKVSILTVFLQIWSLDGRVVQVLDRSKVTPLCAPGSMQAFDPSAAVAGISDQQDEPVRRRRPESMWNQSVSESSTVRDVSWHSSEPAIMSTAWDGPDGQHGSLAKHVSKRQRVERERHETDFGYLCRNGRASARMASPWKMPSKSPSQKLLGDASYFALYNPQSFALIILQ
jgi:hypothetical protein